MNESQYRRRLEGRIIDALPSSFILRNDPREIQGIPDIIILCGDRWAMLELKISADAETQPNQEYYVNLMSESSYAAFIYPEIEDEIIDELIEYFHGDRWDQ